MKKHTKKQIVEAISYWKKQLEESSEIEEASEESKKPSEREVKARLQKMSSKFKSEEDAKKAVDSCEKKMKDPSFSKKFREIAEDLKMIFGLLKDSLSGKFKLEFSTLAILTAAVVYVVSPVDLIPDYIPVVGVLDDSVVIGWVMRAFADEISRYREFRKSQLKEAISFWKKQLKKMNESSQDSRIYELEMLNASKKFYSQSGRYLGEMSDQQFQSILDEIVEKYDVDCSISTSGRVKFKGRKAELEAVWSIWNEREFPENELVVV